MSLNNINSSNLIPTQFYLGQNYPNPFTEKTSIKFCVAYKIKICLEVYDSEGKIFKQLLNEEKEPGTYEVEFSAYGLNKGCYNYRFQAGDFISTKVMNLRVSC